MLLSLLSLALQGQAFSGALVYTPPPPLAGVTGGHADASALAALAATRRLAEPVDLTWFYFSAEGPSGFWGEGSDSNPCEPSAPCLSIQHAFDLWKDGGVGIVLDTDVWDSAAELNGFTGGRFDPASCGTNSPEEFCALWVGADPTGVSLPVIRCNAQIDDGEILTGGEALFHDTRSSRTGWMGAVGVEFQECGQFGGGVHALFASNGPGSQVAIVGVKQHDMVGNNSITYTGRHDGAWLVAIGLDWTGAPGGGGPSSPSAAPTYQEGGHTLVIVDKPFESLDDTGTTATIPSLPFADGSLFISGSGVTGLSPGNDHLGLVVGCGADDVDFQVRAAGLHFYDYDGPGGGAFEALTAGDRCNLDMDLFRQTVTTSLAAFQTSAFGLGADPPADGVIWDVTGRCVLIDEMSGVEKYIAEIEDVDKIDLDLEGVYDSDEGTQIARLDAIDYASLSQVQMLSTPNAGNGFTNFFETGVNFDSGGPLVDGNPFGSSGPSEALCDPSAECFQACPTRWTVDFDGGIYVPRAIRGVKITGVDLNASGDANIGAN